MQERPAHADANYYACSLSYLVCRRDYIAGCNKAAEAEQKGRCSMESARCGVIPGNVGVKMDWW